MSRKPHVTKINKEINEIVAKSENVNEAFFYIKRYYHISEEEIFRKLDDPMRLKVILTTLLDNLDVHKKYHHKTPEELMMTELRMAKNKTAEIRIINKYKRKEKIICGKCKEFRQPNLDKPLLCDACYRDSFKTSKQMEQDIQNKLVRGVTYDKAREMWFSKVIIKKKYIFLGRFDTKILAYKAYYKAKTDADSKNVRLLVHPDVVAGWDLTD